MIWLLLAVFTPLAGVLLLALLPRAGAAGWANLGFSALSLAGALGLATRVLRHGVLDAHGFRVDAFNVYLVVLTTFVGLTTAVFSRPYMYYVHTDEKRVSARGMRLYHSMYQGFLFTMLLALTTDNLGILWVAVEGATLATVLLVSLYRTPAAIEAAWKYFILCTVGISLALMGLILLYYSAIHSHSAADSATLYWSNLAKIAGKLNPNILLLSFVFTLIGYGTKVGLAPMHTWLPDAHSEAPSPVSAILSGMLLNGAMYGVIRAHTLVLRRMGPGISDHLLLYFGLASLGVAVPFIIRQRDFKRLLAYSSVEHMGIVAIGLGLGTPLAIFGALLHTLYHSLVKSTMFMSVGNVLLKYKTREITQVSGVLKSLPVTGPVMILGAFAIAGAPPFGLFLSEFTILEAGFKSGQFLPSALMLAAIVLIFAGMGRHFSLMAFGGLPAEVSVGETSSWNWLPIVVFLILAACLGLYLPPLLVKALHQIVAIVQGTP